MKKMLFLSAVSVLSIGVLIACNDDSVQENSQQESNNGEEITDKDQIEDGEDGSETYIEGGSSLVDRNDSEEDGSDEEKSEPNLGEGDTEDQLDLKIGDTGTIETTIDQFSITLNAVEITDQLEDETPDREYFVLADVTLENMVDSTLDIREALDVLELTGDLEGGGGRDFSHLYEGVETMEGALESGEEVSGQLLFEADNFDEFYIRVREGLVSSSAVKNQTIWTFTQDETD